MSDRALVRLAAVLLMLALALVFSACASHAPLPWRYYHSPPRVQQAPSSVFGVYAVGTLTSTSGPATGWEAVQPI